MLTAARNMPSATPSMLRVHHWRGASWDFNGKRIPWTGLRVRILESGGRGIERDIIMSQGDSVGGREKVGEHVVRE